MLLEALKNLDLLAINRVEAETLVPVICGLANDCRETEASDAIDDDPPGPRLMRIGLAFGGFDMDLMSYLSRMRSMGVAKVVITDGTHGAYLADDAGIHYCPSVKVEPKGTAGAGDSYTSTLCTHLAGGIEAGFAMRAAAINSASVVGSVDTQSGLLDSATLRERVETLTSDLPIITWEWAS